MEYGHDDTVAVVIGALKTKVDRRDSEIERLKAGLKFYADGTHYSVRDEAEGDEDAVWNGSDPGNWLDNWRGAWRPSCSCRSWRGTVTSV